MDQAEQLVSPGDGRYRYSSYKEHLRTYHYVKIAVCLSFLNRTTSYFHMEIYCNCASHIPIAVHKWEHMNSSKWCKILPRLQQPGQSTTYLSSTLQLYLKSCYSCSHHPTHVSIRCTETPGSSKQCFALISQVILLRWGEIALDCCTEQQVICHSELPVGDGWFTNHCFSEACPITAQSTIKNCFRAVQWEGEGAYTCSTVRGS